MEQDIEARFSSIDRRFDGVDARLDSMDKRFDGTDSRLDAMDKRFDGIDARLDGIDSRLDAMDKRFDGIDQRLDGIDENIVAVMGAVESGFARMQRFFEVVVEDIRSDFRAVKEQSRDHSERIQSLEASRENHQEQLGQLTAICARLEKRAS